MNTNSTAASQLRKTLTTKDLTVYGMMFMVPVAPFAWYGSFVIPAGGMVALAYLIAAIAMLFTGFSYAAFSHRYTLSGSVYSYVQKGVNAEIGFLAGWTITLDYFLLPSVFYLIGALFISQLVPDVPAWAWILVFAAFGTIINALGVKLMARASWALFFFQIVVIAYFIIAVIIGLFSGKFHLTLISFYNAAHFNLSGVVHATAIVVLSYLGFDAISTLSEEAYDAKRTIGLASILSIVLIGSLFIVMSFFAGVAYPHYQSLKSATASLNVVKAAGGEPLLVLTVIALFLSFGFAGGLESQASLARYWFAMGRDGILPRSLGYVHPRYQTPFVAIIAIGVLSALVGIFVPLSIEAELLSFGALMGFMSLNASVVWHLFLKDKKSVYGFFVYLISPLLGLMIDAYIFSGLHEITYIVGGVWFFAGFVQLIYKTRLFTRPAPQMDFES